MPYTNRFSGPFSDLGSRNAVALIAALIALTLIFSLTETAMAQKYQVAHRFNFSDGSDPSATLLRDNKSNLYGTTSAGGFYGFGTVFRFNPTGLTTLYSFSAGTDGCEPLAGLIRDTAGNLYGTTSDNCLSLGHGTVFRIDASGNYMLLYTFKGHMFGDGENPSWGGKLLRDRAGNLYGTTRSGGDRSACGGVGCGVVFKLDPHGAEVVLHAFTGTEGMYPSGALILDSNGDLYGTAWTGGAHSSGTIFRLSGTVLTVLHDFDGATDGAGPIGNLIRDAAGNFYGATEDGGAHGCGTIFKIDTSGNLSVLYSFGGGKDGSTPLGGLVQDSEGNLYGTTYARGDATACHLNGCGTIFKLRPDGVLEILHTLLGGSDGESPSFEELVLDPKGALYGTAEGGRVHNGYGVIFKLTP